MILLKLRFELQTRGSFLLGTIIGSILYIYNYVMVSTELQLYELSLLLIFFIVTTLSFELRVSDYPLIRVNKKIVRVIKIVEKKLGV